MKIDISIIVPLYKGKKYINYVIEQVRENVNVLKEQRQNVQVELIFINDFPEEKMDCEVQATFPITIIENEKNEGVHTARIVGYKASKGKYILFLDQDDIIDKNYLISQFNAVGENDAVVCNGWYRNGRKIFSVPPQIDLEWLLNNFKLIRSPGQVLILKDAIPQYWLENVIVNSGADDIFLWSLMAIDYKKWCYNGSDLYIHIEDGTNTSFNWEKQKQSLLEVKEKVRIYCSKDIFIKWEEYVNESIIKFSGYAEIEKKWCRLGQEGKVKEYLQKNQVNSLAVYGYGVIGKRFCEELHKLNIAVDYVFDKAKISVETGIRLVSKIEECEAVDLMIVTPVFAYQQIVKVFENVTIKKIISISELLENI